MADTAGRVLGHGVVVIGRDEGLAGDAPRSSFLVMRCGDCDGAIRPRLAMTNRRERRGKGRGMLAHSAAAATLVGAEVVGRVSSLRRVQK